VTEAPASLTRFAWLSIAAAVATIVLKAVAYELTGSVGLLSDALESGVNLVAAVMALAMLRLAERPADEEHAFGRSKAEYFSSGVEGALILVAALGIAYEAADRLLHPRALEALGIGLAVSTAAALVNFGVARVLLAAGRRHGSITLEADGHHLMTDVWTSVGVLVGVGLVALTGRIWLDPVVAIGVALNIVRTGWTLMRRSASGLMDHALPRDEIARIEAVLQSFAGEGILWHALKTRQAGTRRFVTVHVLVPGAWSVQRGHDAIERIESKLAALFPTSTILTHLEPIEDARAWNDEGLDRPPS
jgi:cation diffusion facilitator family transporter